MNELELASKCLKQQSSHTNRDGNKQQRQTNVLRIDITWNSARYDGVLASERTRERASHMAVVLRSLYSETPRS